jgi:hypothetical protein
MPTTSSPTCERRWRCDAGTRGSGGVPACASVPTALTFPVMRVQLWECKAIRLAVVAAGLGVMGSASRLMAQEPPLPSWDRAVRADAGLIRPVGRFIWTNLGYGPCPVSLALPDSVTLVGRSAGAADSIGAVARLDAENSEQWTGVSLPRDPAWRSSVRVVSARCRDNRAVQLIVQQGAAYAVVFAEHPSALGAEGFLRAAPSAGLGPLGWRTTPAGITIGR